MKAVDGETVEEEGADKKADPLSTTEADSQAGATSQEPSDERRNGGGESFASRDKRTDEATAKIYGQYKKSIKNSVVGSFIKNVYIQTSEAGSQPIDITIASLAIAESYIPHPGFISICDELERLKLVVIPGRPNHGRRTSAVSALVAVGASELMRIPSDCSFEELQGWVDGVAQESDGHSPPKVRYGLVIEEPQQILSRPDWPGLSSLLAASRARGVAIVITAPPRQGSNVGQNPQIVVADLGALTTQQLVSTATGSLSNQDDLDLFELVLTNISDATYSEARRVLGLIRDGVRDPEMLADANSAEGAERAVTRWLGPDGRSANEVCAVLVGCAGVGLSASSVLDLASVLAAQVDPKDRQALSPARFGVRDDLRDQPFIEISHGSGDIEERVIQNSAKFEAWQAFLAVWSRLDHDFRRVFFSWLEELPRYSQIESAVVASNCMGFLISTSDNARAVSSLRSWSESISFWHLYCAATAVGVAAPINNGGVVGRQTVRSWYRSKLERDQILATLAYGGLYGGVDSDATAPFALWRLGKRPYLRQLSDEGFVALICEFYESPTLRTITLEMLLEHSRGRPEHAERAYGILAMSLRRLMKKEMNQSLAGLLDDPPQYDAMIACTAQVLTRPIGRPAGQRIVGELLRGVNRGTLPSDRVYGLLNDVRLVAAADGREAEFLMRMRHHLAFARRDRRAWEFAAETLLDRLLSTKALS